MSAPAKLIETHISTVLLIGDRAYKLKKPVKTGFLDFSTPEARRTMCEREVELNRRFSRDVYLGVASVLDVEGHPCDSLVVMRRLPEERKLAALVGSGADVHDDIRHIARLLAGFHAGAATSAAISAAASIDSVRTNWENNFTQMAEFVGPVLDGATAHRVELLARSYLAGRRPLFEARIAAGMARDGHGDLKADDIFCMEDGPRILDCIEFDDLLRYGDVLADVAFLAMDLERLGAPSLAGEFLREYVEYSAEAHPDSLIHHYIAYRAHVRAKVACLRHQQGEPSAAADAGRLLAISRDHLERARVRLVIVGGPPASGKSTLATALADALGWAIIRSDEVRKDLAGIAHDASAAAPVGEGIYRPELVAATYDEVLRRAGLLLGRGFTVVLDATWRDERTRDAARKLAHAACADIVEVRTTAPIELLEARLAGREPGAETASDATVDVLAWMRFDPWPVAMEIDTSGPIAHALAAAVAAAALEQLPGRTRL